MGLVRNVMASLDSVKLLLFVFLTLWFVLLLFLNLKPESSLLLEWFGFDSASLLDWFSFDKSITNVMGALAVIGALGAAIATLLKPILKRFGFDKVRSKQKEAVFNQILHLLHYLIVGFISLIATSIIVIVYLFSHIILYGQGHESGVDITGAFPFNIFFIIFFGILALQQWNKVKKQQPFSNR